MIYMKLGFVIKIFILLLFLSQYQLTLFAGRTHFSGFNDMGLEADIDDQKKQVGRRLMRAVGEERLPSWWSEDYSLPHKRRPVHNSLHP